MSNYRNILSREVSYYLFPFTSLWYFTGNSFSCYVIIDMLFHENKNNRKGLISPIIINNTNNISILVKKRFVPFDLCKHHNENGIFVGSAKSWEVLYVGLIDFGLGAAGACVFFFFYSMRNVLTGLLFYLKLKT